MQFQELIDNIKNYLSIRFIPSENLKIDFLDDGGLMLEFEYNYITYIKNITLVIPKSNDVMYFTTLILKIENDFYLRNQRLAGTSNSWKDLIDWTLNPSFYQFPIESVILGKRSQEEYNKINLK